MKSSRPEVVECNQNAEALERLHRVRGARNVFDENAFRELEASGLESTPL